MTTGLIHQQTTQTLSNMTMTHITSKTHMPSHVNGTFVEMPLEIYLQKQTASFYHKVFETNRMPGNVQKLSRQKMYIKDNVYVNPLAPEFSALHTLQMT